MNEDHGFPDQQLFFSCDALEFGEQAFVHAGSVSAMWETHSILRRMKEAEAYARSLKANRLVAKACVSKGLFPRTFNILIGNGYRWVEDELFERKLNTNE
jgi:hypothetical protein